jgi:hypothetical protein
VIPAQKAFTVTFGFVMENETMKLTAIKQSHQLTEKTRLSYHRAASLLLAIGFSSLLNHALQGGSFSSSY